MHKTRKRLSGAIAWILVTIGVGILVSPPQSTAQQLAADPVRLLEATSQGLIVEFTLPAYTLRPVSTDGQIFTAIHVPGFSPGAGPGAPQLPHTGAMIGLPPAGRATVHVLESEQTTLSLAHPIQPAPLPAPGYTGMAKGSPPPASANVLQADDAIYAQDAAYPSDSVALSELGQVRGHRVARLAFHPFRYNPVRGELAVTQHLLIEVRFPRGWEASSPSTPAAQAIASNTAFDSLLDRALLNGESARGWQVASERPMLPAHVSATSANPPATQPGTYLVNIVSDGLYRLTYASLRDAGLPVDGLDPATWQLFEQGQEIAILVEGQGDGRFDPGDSILFYGRVPRSRYTAHNVYWLRYGDALGLRMTTRSVAPGTEPAGTTWARARYEDNRFYDPKYPAADGDHWYAADLRPIAGYDYTATLSLMPLDTDVPTATLRVGMVGYTTDHQTTFWVNGGLAGALAWSGHDPVTATTSIDRALLSAGSNQVYVAANAPNQGTWLDAIEIDYAFQAVNGDEAHFWGQSGARRYTLNGFASSDVRLYDVSDPQHPVQLEGGTGGGGVAFAFADTPAVPATYLALTGANIREPAAILSDTPSDLRDGTNGADYLVIAHADLIGAIQPLVSHRQSQGLRTAVVDVQDIYDEFSGGLLDPEAIRAFIAYAYDNWARPAPTYVLLVGDGSYDFLDHFGYGSANFVPPYLAMVDPWWGETAADQVYASIDGDQLADVLLGRLPVTNASEAATVVSKILSYEQSPWLGDWNSRHVFVADELDNYGNDFAASADAVYAAYVQDPWTGSKIYLDDLSVTAARQETLAAWQRGALLVTFIGHSSWHQWAVANMFDFYDVPSLRNGQRLPVVLSMTCFTGYFHHPEYSTLDESLLRLQGGGAVATVSPSGLGVATGHDYLLQGFYNAVFTDGQSRLGVAVASAKLNLSAKAPAHADLLDTYHLFGDPAMALNLTIRPWPHSVYLPFVSRGR